MAAVAIAPARTLDEVLRETIAALVSGRGATCLMCGERAFAMRELSGAVTHTCRSCGSSFE